jgi:carbonic anhydrase
MAFSWEPFGSTRADNPEPAPPPAPATASEPAAPRGLSRTPARRLAVLTCMDCRVDPLRALGLRLGDAVVLRNAGAQASDDMLRSLRMAHGSLGVEAVTVMAHTDCAAHGGDDTAAAAAARRAAARIRSALPLRADMALLDLRTGTLSRQDGAPRPTG